MSDMTGKVTVDIDAEDISNLMDSGTTRVLLADGALTVHARCEDSLQFEVVADE